MFSLINLIGYTTIMSITPGPNNVICLAQGTKYGFKAAFPYTLGVALGLVTQLWLLLVFSSFIGAYLPTLTKLISYLGAGYMVYMAIKMLHLTSAKEPNPTNTRPIGIVTSTFFQYANPKAYIFNTTIITSFILPFAYTPQQNMLISLLLSLIFILCTNAWVFFGQAFNRLLNNHQKAVSYTLSATLIYLAISIILH